MRNGPQAAPGSYALADDVYRLETEIESLRDDVSAMSERLEFTEKLLMRGDGAGSGREES